MVWTKSLLPSLIGRRGLLRLPSRGLISRPHRPASVAILSSASLRFLTAIRLVRSCMPLRARPFQPSARRSGTSRASSMPKA